MSSSGGARLLRCTLAWETAATVSGEWQLDQCDDTKRGCHWNTRQTVPGRSREATADHLPRNQGQCWRVVPRGTPQVADISNLICR